MNTITKQDVLDAIRETAKRNEGIPLGEGRFEKETGIKRYDLHKAGFAANTLQAAHD